ncbi:MAG: 3-isopropylmalate/(R)-2-methylmalate dehydratase large subunit [Pseudomonadota bacterium]|jgi:3-isopropylmalate/(R)-2-methylmalate dehydratase large subunit
MASSRILYLLSDAAAMHGQLQDPGPNLADRSGWHDLLRDDISTDEITPVAIMSHYDQQLGRFAYTGFKAGDALPLVAGAVQRGGFQVVVAGQRYGKGSSREHSPAAELYAGVRLVFARSFERIYRQNADNIGLLTSTDFALLARIERGETVGLDELLAGREELAQRIVRSGGLLAFGQSALSAAAPLPTAAPGPQTLFEKIVARHRLMVKGTPARAQTGDGVFVRADWRFIHEYYTGMAAHMLQARFSPGYALHEPDGVLVFEDHSSYIEQSPAHLKNGLVPNMQRMRQAQRNFVTLHGLRCHTTLTDDEAARDDGSNVAGISHAMVAEHYALPGQLVVGTDSHTPHSGALGCAAYGVGTTDMANAFMTGAVRLTTPAQLLVNLLGAVPAGVTAKDIVLHLLARPDIRAGVGVGRVFEFAGPVIARLSTDERATLTNMTAELGGTTGIVAPDAETLRFLKDRRGIDAVIEPWMHSDPAAVYERTIDVDCSTLVPMVARPGDPGHGMPLSALDQDVRIDMAYGGSCTAGKREDFDHYHAVLAWGLAQGMTLPPHVTLYLQYGTTAVRDYCIAHGYDRTFNRMGAHILQPSCGACANCGPGSSTDANQVTVSAINRNFPGRSGPGQVWLASPPTVVASALAGRLMSFEQLQAQALNPP